MNKTQLKDRIAVELINELLVEINNERDRENPFGIMYLEEQREFYVFKRVYEEDNTSFMLKASEEEDNPKDYVGILEGVVSWIDYDKQKKIKEEFSSTYEFVETELNKLENIKL